MLTRRSSDRFPGVTKRQVTAIAAVVAIVVCTVEQVVLHQAKAWASSSSSSARCT